LPTKPSYHLSTDDIATLEWLRATIVADYETKLAKVNDKLARLYREANKVKRDKAHAPKAAMCDHRMEPMFHGQNDELAGMRCTKCGLTRWS